MSTSIIYTYQEAIRDFLNGLSEMEGLTFLERRQGRLVNDIAAGKERVKIAGWVWPVLPTRVNPNVPGPQYDVMQVRVTIFENYDLNHDAARHAEWYSREILRQLHNARPTGLEHDILSEEVPIEFGLTPGGLEQWDILMTTSGGETPTDNAT